MSAFNTKVNIVGFRLIPEEGEKKTGVTVVLTIGMPFPVSETQVAMIPFGDVAFELDKDSTENISEALAEAAKDMVAPSNIAVASNLNEVAGAAKVMEDFRGS